MMGGIDISLPTRVGAASLEVTVRAIRQRWPQAVFENSLSGDRYNQFWEIPFGVLAELFVYSNSMAADQWDAEGAIPAARNTMIHLIADQDLMTLVIDERDAAMNEIISAISSGLNDRYIYMEAETAA